MTEPFNCGDELHDLDRRITCAWQALNGARATANRYPTGMNLLAEELTERTLNELLEARHEMVQHSVSA